MRGVHLHIIAYTDQFSISYKTYNERLYIYNSSEKYRESIMADITIQKFIDAYVHVCKANGYIYENKQ